MFLKYLWLLLLIISLYVLYIYDFHKEVKLNFMYGGLSFLDLNKLESNEKSVEFPSKVNREQRLFALDELKKYTNLEKGLYLSILGKVFDVTKGAKHYGPGETYHAFTGRDASLAFITGEFDEKALTDDISSLSVQQVKALDGWVQFYNKNYIYKGKLKGRYYNDDGSPTLEFYKMEGKLQEALRADSKEEQKKKMFPPCNVEWNIDTGTKFWCTRRSGGVERDWIGVPRQYFESPGSTQYRCACVNLHSEEYEDQKGSFKQYDGCTKTSAQCFVKANK